MTVDEVQAKLESIKKKYIPFTDFNFENDLSIEEYIYRIGKWFKSLLDEFETLEDTATESVTQSAANAETAQEAAETAASAAQDAASAKQDAASAAQDAQEAAEDAASASSGILQDAKDYTDTKDTATLQSAKDYADTKTNAINTRLDNISPFKQNAQLLTVFELDPTITTESGASIQGTTKLGKFVFSCDINENRILRYNTETKETVTVETFTSGAYGHCNDMANDGSNIYIAPGPDIAGKIFRIPVNANTGAIGASMELTVPNSLNIWNLTYDFENECFYTVTSDNGYLYTLTINGTTVTVDNIKEFDFWDYWPDRPRQGVEYNDGYLYTLSSTSTLPLNACMSVFKIDDEISYIGRISLQRTLGEPECIVADRENHLLLIGVPTWGVYTNHPTQNIFYAIDYKNQYALDELTGFQAYNTTPANEITAYAAHMLNASREVTPSPDTILRIARKWWGTSLKVKLNPAGHFFVFAGNTRFYIGTFTGNPITVQFTEHGSGSGATVTASFDSSTNILTLTASTSCPLACVYTNGTMFA